jgi:hypothetical protein
LHSNLLKFFWSEFDGLCDAIAHISLIFFSLASALQATVASFRTALSALEVAAFAEAGVHAMPPTSAVTKMPTHKAAALLGAMPPALSFSNTASARNGWSYSSRSHQASREWRS